MTYLPTAEGWLYLACWLDLATREVVGYLTPAETSSGINTPSRHNRRVSKITGKLQPSQYPWRG
jgi:hypothetical protein